MTYTTWEYYCSLYDKISDESVFNKLNIRASAEIDMRTGLRVFEFESNYDETIATGFEKITHSKIMNMACELINQLSVYDNSAMGTGLTSVSNGGYSESYKITSNADKKSEIKSLIVSGLSGTGLAGAY